MILELMITIAEVAAESSFNPAQSNWMNWAEVVVTIVGFVVIGLQIGDFKGQQKVKNETYEKDIKDNKENIAAIKEAINDIRVSMADIAGQLKGTDHIKD